MSGIPKRRKRGESLLDFSDDAISWMRANQLVNVIGGKVKRSPNGVTLDVRQTKGPSNAQPAKPPLWVTLFKDPDDNWKIYVQDARVIARHNATGDAVGTLSITALPTKASPMTVDKDDKLTIKLDIDSDGLVTDATFTKTATTWPASAAPILQGGDRQGENIHPATDDAKGSVGEHHIRVAEITELQAATGSLPQVLGVNQLNTGHVDHFQPMLAENCIVTAGTSEARILQKFDTTGGEWKLRTLAPAEVGPTIGFTEDVGRIRANTTGATFKVNLWQTDITLLSPANTLEIDNGISELAEFWVLNGVWYTAEPDGFPASPTEYNFSYVTPTTGGP